MNALPIELIVVPEDDGCSYRAEWADGDPVVTHIQEILLDLIPFMLARKLLEQGYNVERIVVVRLQGADFELMRAPLGAAAATPLLNSAAPVKQPTRTMMFARSRRG
jgi:hypothetical protein